MDFQRFAEAHGLLVDSFIMDGRIHRCRTSHKPRSNNGAYMWAGEYGFCMDWAVHDSPQIWITDREVDHKEIQIKIRKNLDAYKKERAKINQLAIKKAELMLSRCQNDLSQYLASKGFHEMCFNMLFEDGKDPLLCVPMRINGRISGLQTIDPKGQKKFIYGTNASMATFDIGGGGQVFLVEGLASGLSMQKVAAHLKIPYTVKVCFSAGNMAKVANLLKDPVLICDNDESKTGERVGIESGKKYYVPPVTGQDINDECLQSNYFTVSQKIKKLLYLRLNHV